MPKKPDFDLQDAHKYFSAYCFNSVWEFIDKEKRTPEEDGQMINLCHTSIWHWTEREDCTNRSMSVGYWQASRVYALVGQAENARKYGQHSLELCQVDEPFYIGYAYEALARAEMIAGNHDKMEEYLDLARKQSDAISDAEEKKMLVDDLATIK
jgi:hypothetical protein